MEALKNIQDQKLFNSMDVSLKANIGSGNGLSAFSKVNTHASQTPLFFQKPFINSCF